MSFRAVAQTEFTADLSNITYAYVGTGLLRNVVNYSQIVKFKDELSRDFGQFGLKYVWRFCTLGEEFIEQAQDLVDWFYIGKYQVLSEHFIEKWIDKLSWSTVSKYQLMSEKFMALHFKQINWDYLVTTNLNVVLSKKFIEEHFK